LKSLAERLPLRTVRLIDVARRAGVSAASVSRVLNTPEKVSAELREQVAAALKELRYVPHGAARALASQRSRTIGAVVPTLDISIFAKGIEALQTRLQEFGYTLLIASAEYDPAKELELTRSLIERGVDGLALVGARHVPAVEELLDASGLPHVNTYSYEAQAARPCVGIDNRAGTYRLTRHLIELGHREFAILTSPRRNNDRVSARFEGIQACLDDHGIAVPPQAIVEVPYSIADGRAGLRALLASGHAFTALPCTTDVIAFGALAECRAQEIAVPGEVSITGFDDLEPAAHLDPPLTTLVVPTEELGRRAADYLLDRIAGRTVLDHIELAASLILRGSTAPPPAHRDRLAVSVTTRGVRHATA
jgi:LacI family transcriptional regulator